MFHFKITSVLTLTLVLTLPARPTVSSLRPPFTGGVSVADGHGLWSSGPWAQTHSATSSSVVLVEFCELSDVVSLWKGEDTGPLPWLSEPQPVKHSGGRSAANTLSCDHPSLALHLFASLPLLTLSFFFSIFEEFPAPF